MCDARARVTTIYKQLKLLITFIPLLSNMFNFFLRIGTLKFFKKFNELRACIFRNVKKEFQQYFIFSIRNDRYYGS